MRRRLPVLARPPKRDGRAVWLDVRSALESGLARTSAVRGQESLRAVYAAVEAIRGAGREIAFETVGTWCVKNHGGPTAESIKRNERLADIVRVAVAVQAADGCPGDDRPVEVRVVEQIGDASLRAAAQIAFAEARSFRLEHETLLLVTRRVAALATIGAEMGGSKPMAEVAAGIAAPAAVAGMRLFSDEEGEHCRAFLDVGLGLVGLSLDKPSGEIIDRSMRTVAGPGVHEVLRAAGNADHTGCRAAQVPGGGPAPRPSQSAARVLRIDTSPRGVERESLSWSDVGDAMRSALERTESPTGTTALRRVHAALELFWKERRPISVQAVGDWCVSEHGGPKAQSMRNNQRIVELVQLAQAVQAPDVKPAGSRPVEDQILEQIGSVELRTQAAALLTGRRAYKTRNDALRAALKQGRPIAVVTTEMVEATLEELEGLAAAITAARVEEVRLEFPEDVRADCRTFLVEGLSRRGLTIDEPSGEIVDAVQRTIARSGVVSALRKVAAGR